LIVGWLGRDPAQVAVLESVAVSLQADDLGVMGKSIIAAATTSSPNTSPQRPNGLLLVTIKLALSYLAETSWKNRFARASAPG
jgi:hypothetical protein